LPILGEVPFQEEYVIQAEIKAYSEEPIYLDSTKVYYRVNGEEYSALEMTFQGGDSYFAAIPAPPPGSEVEYYIHTADASVRSENNPFIGAPDPHSFTIEEIQPEPPSDLHIEIVGNDVTLSWTASPSPFVNIYHVYRSNNPYNSFQWIGNSTTTFYTDTTATDTKCFYYVTADVEENASAKLKNVIINKK